MDAGFPPIDDPTAGDLDEINRQYRGNASGSLLFDDNLLPLDFCIAADGHLIAPVMVAVLSSMDTVIFAPEESEEALQLLVTPEELGGIDYESADTDRWRVYHGEPQDVRWAKLWVESLKLRELVFDGEAVARPNPFAEAEPRLCRELNQRPTDIQQIAHRLLSVEIAEPTVVGVDPWGIDVRARFGVVRLMYPQRLNSADLVLETLKNELH